MLKVLEFYGLEKQNKWAQLGYESLFFAGFTFLAWAVSNLTSLVLVASAEDLNNLVAVNFSLFDCVILMNALLKRSMCRSAGTGICQAPEEMSVCTSFICDEGIFKLTSDLARES